MGTTLSIRCIVVMKKHPTTIARWIYLGLRKQREDQSFRELIDTLDRRNSRSVRNNPTTQ